MGNFPLQIYDIYTTIKQRNTVITVIEQVIWGRITRRPKTAFCANALFALRLVRFRFECALEDIFRLETRNTVSYYLAFDQ